MLGMPLQTAQPRRCWRRLLGVFVAVAIASVHAGSAQRLIWLGVPQGGRDSAATDVNNDGFIAGWSTKSNGRRQAVVWRSPDPNSIYAIPMPTQFGNFDSSESPAIGVINAWLHPNRTNTIRAFPLDGSLNPTQFQGNAWSWLNSAPTYATGRDGVIGKSGTGGGCAYLYVPGASSYNYCNVYGLASVFTGVWNYLSTNSTIIVGYKFENCGPQNLPICKRGFVWVYGADPTTTTVYFDRYEVPTSVQGNHIVGNVELEREILGFGIPLYFNFNPITRTYTRTLLPTPSGSRDALTSDINAAGNTIVGLSYRLQGEDILPFATIWTYSDGSWVAARLNDLYSNLLGGGSSLWYATSISEDGRYIVGQGWNAQTRRTEAFVLDRGPQCRSHLGDVNDDCRIDDADLLAVLFAFGQTGSDLGRVDVNCDSAADDADLLIVLFNFGLDC